MADRVTVELAVVGVGPNATVANRSMRAALDRARTAVTNATGNATMQVIEYDIRERNWYGYSQPIAGHTTADGASPQRGIPESGTVRTAVPTADGSEHATGGVSRTATDRTVAVPPERRFALRVHTAVLEVRAAATHAPALVAVAEGSDNSVRRVEYGLSTELRRAAAERAIGAATDAARAEARMAANATNRSVGSATNVEVVGNGTTPTAAVEPEQVGERSEGELPVSITVNRQVGVTYASDPA